MTEQPSENEIPAGEACSRLHHLIQGITATRHNTLTEATSGIVKEICDDIASEIYTLHQTYTTTQLKAYLPSLMTFLDVQLSAIHTYKRLLRQHMPYKWLWLEHTASFIHELMLQLPLHWTCCPLPENIPWMIMEILVQSYRWQWHEVHVQLVTHIQQPDLRLVAMNLVRQCRPATDVPTPWNRFSYTNDLLAALADLTAGASHPIPVCLDEPFIDLLIGWNYSDTAFLQYYTDEIDNRIRKATTYTGMIKVYLLLQQKVDILISRKTEYISPAGVSEFYTNTLEDFIRITFTDHLARLQTYKKG